MAKNRFHIILMIVSFCCLAFNASAERDDCDFSTRFDVGVSKKFFKRLELGFDETVVLDNNSSSINKISSKVDVSYAVVRKIFKVGVSYYAIAKHKNDDYFFNQRFQGYTNVKAKAGRFSFAWRSRYQMTYRPERKESKQWRSYWRNSLSVTFKVPHVSLYPSVSAEMFYKIDKSKESIVNSMRYEAGLKYELNKRNALKLYYRYDDEFNVKNPLDVSTVGLSYQISL